MALAGKRKLEAPAAQAAAFECWHGGECKTVFFATFDCERNLASASSALSARANAARAVTDVVFTFGITSLGRVSAGVFVPGAARHAAIPVTGGKSAATFTAIFFYNLRAAASCDRRTALCLRAAALGLRTAALLLRATALDYGGAALWSYAAAACYDCTAIWRRSDLGTAWRRSHARRRGDRLNVIYAFGSRLQNRKLRKVRRNRSGSVSEYDSSVCHVGRTDCVSVRVRHDTVSVNKVVASRILQMEGRVANLVADTVAFNDRVCGEIDVCDNRSSGQVIDHDERGARNICDCANLITCYVCNCRIGVDKVWLVSDEIPS